MTGLIVEVSLMFVGVFVGFTVVMGPLYRDGLRSEVYRLCQTKKTILATGFCLEVSLQCFGVSLFPDFTVAVLRATESSNYQNATYLLTIKARVAIGNFGECGDDTVVVFTH